MTGQDGGFRAAAARFSAEVESALTRARRAASEAKAQSAEFRTGTRELAEQAKTGRLRGVLRGQVEPTTAEPRAEALKFRNANGLADELAAADLPDAGTLIARLPAPAPEPEPDDEDFSQHQILNDIDDEPPAERDSGPDAPESSDNSGDSSQQRIPLLDDTGAFRDEDLPTILDELSPRQNPS